jgi:hypothetical protein
MKNRITMMALAVAAIGLISSSCTMADSKNSAESAKEKAINSAQEMNQQIKDSMQLFRKETEKRIANYEKQMAELKLDTKKKTNSEYDKIMANIEQKNKELRKRLEEANDVNQTNWDKFKSEFNNDMKSIEEAFKNLTVDNVK